MVPLLLQPWPCWKCIFRRRRRSWCVSHRQRSALWVSRLRCCVGDDPVVQLRRLDSQGLHLGDDTLAMGMDSPLQALIEFVAAVHHTGWVHAGDGAPNLHSFLLQIDDPSCNLQIGTQANSQDQWLFDEDED